MNDKNNTDEGAEGLRARRVAYIVVGVVLALGLLTVGGFALSEITTDEWEADEGAIFDADDGPEVELGTDLVIDRRHPIPGDGSVDLRPEIRVEGDDGSSLRYDGYVGDFVRFDEMDLTSETTLIHENEGEIAIDGTATGFEWREMNIDSNEPDLAYRGGTIEVEVETGVPVRVVDVETGDTIAFASESDGVVSFSLSAESEWTEISLLQSEGGPQIDQDSAEPTGPQSEEPTQLSIDVSDPDGTDISVEFEHNDESVGSDTITGGNGTATVQTQETVSGDNSWTVTATDEFGNEDFASFEFQAPSELKIWNETAPDQLVDDNIDVEVVFFGSDQTIQSETTSDGTIDLSGLPVDEEWSIQLEADGYFTRQTIIRSIFEQQDVYILPDDTDVVNVRFELNDPTGQFDDDNSRVLVRKPITRDGTTSYDVVVGDMMGAGGFSTILEQDQRYLIEVENIDTGQTRTLGPYVATASENVILQVDQIQFEFEDEEIGYQWAAEWFDDEEADPAVDFAFAADHGIVQLEVEMIERSTGEVIFDGVYTDESEVQERVTIPESIEDPERSSVTVVWSAVVLDEDGNQNEIEGSVTVGPDQMPVDAEGVPTFVLQVVSVFLIFVVGGLFSVANAEIGAIVTSLFAGVLWFIGFLPGVVSGMMIALALLVSVMWWARRARGPM